MGYNMAEAISTSVAQLNYELLNQGSAPSGTLWMGLSTSGIATNGTGGAEPSGGYSRVQVLSNTTNWTAPVNGYISNTGATELKFTSVSDWGNIVSVFFAATSTVGAADVKYYSNLDTSLAIPANTQVIFNGGSITIGRR